MVGFLFFFGLPTIFQFPFRPITSRGCGMYYIANGIPTYRNGRCALLIYILCRGIWPMKMVYLSNKKRAVSWTDDVFHTYINNSLLSKNNEWMNLSAVDLALSMIAMVAKICKQNVPIITHIFRRLKFNNILKGRILYPKRQTLWKQITKAAVDLNELAGKWPSDTVTIIKAPYCNCLVAHFGSVAPKRRATEKVCRSFLYDSVVVQVVFLWEPTAKLSVTSLTRSRDLIYQPIVIIHGSGVVHEQYFATRWWRHFRSD